MIRLAGTVVALLVALAGTAARAEEADRPDAVPYRPTVSTPAALSAPGWLEGEAGGFYLRDRHPDADVARRWSVPYTLKLAFTDDWGVRVGGEARVHAADEDGNHATGFGDTQVVGKRRFAVDASSAFGLEGGLTVPSAHRGLGFGSGKPDWSVNGIYSGDLGDWHTDMNLVNTRLGTRQAGEARLQTLGAVAVSHPLVERWTLAGEVSGTHQHGASGTAQLLGAFSYAMRRDLVVDFGAAHGLNRATPNWQAFTGVTMVLGRLD